jgi:hypothetical protein
VSQSKTSFERRPSTVAPKLDNEDEMNPNSFTELDLRKMDAQGSKSAYGPYSMDAQEREKDVVDAFRHSMMTILMKRRSDERSDRNYSMADDQINEFEGTYGVECDFYYEEPYMADELPDDMSFAEDKVYGDRRYEKGQIFYRNESNNDLYWRQGCRPLLNGN